MGRFCAVWMLTCCGGFNGAGTEYGADLGEHMTIPRAQEAVIAHLDESVRQHVLKKPPNALFGSDRRGCRVIRGRVLILKRDLAIFQRDDAIVADGHANDVRGQIAKGVLATADGLAVHDPVLAPGALIDEREQLSLMQLRSELSTEEHGQGFDVD